MQLVQIHSWHAFVGNHQMTRSFVPSLGLCSFGGGILSASMGQRINFVTCLLILLGMDLHRTFQKAFRVLDGRLSLGVLSPGATGPRSTGLCVPVRTLRRPLGNIGVIMSQIRYNIAKILTYVALMSTIYVLTLRNSARRINRCYRHILLVLLTQKMLYQNTLVMEFQRVLTVIKVILRSIDYCIALSFKKSGGNFGMLFSGCSKCPLQPAI